MAAGAEDPGAAVAGPGGEKLGRLGAVGRSEFPVRATLEGVGVRALQSHRGIWPLGGSWPQSHRGYVLPQDRGQSVHVVHEGGEVEWP